MVLRYFPAYQSRAHYLVGLLDVLEGVSVYNHPHFLKHSELWFGLFFHVLQLLPIRFIQQNLCCDSKYMKK